MGEVAASVVIPVFNSAHCLRPCLDSVLAQTRGDFEVICVDNGSTDQSPAILAEYAARDGRVRALSVPEPGVSRARNAGIAQAHGRYLLFVDSDDTVDPRLVERAIGEAEKFDAQLVVYTYDECYEDPCAYFPRPLCPRDEAYGRVVSTRELDFPVSLAVTPNVWRIAFLASYVRELGLRFPEELSTSEDLVFVHRALLPAERVVLLPDMLYHYRRDRSASLTRGDRHAAGILALRQVFSALSPAHGQRWFDLQFVNLVLETFEYQMRTCATPEEYLELFSGYQREWAAYVDEHADLVDGLYARFFSRMQAQDPLVNLFAQHADAEGYAESVRVWDQAHKQELTACHERIGCLEEELAAERARAEALRTELDGVYGSRSWRVARAVAGLARGRGRE